MFLCGVRVELSKIFVEVTAALRHLFQRFAALTQQFNQLRQLRADASIDIFLLNVPLQMRCHIFRCQRINVVMVKPLQFFGVERTGRLTHRTKGEQFDHLFTGEDFLIAAGPAQTHQIVQQRFRKVTVVAILHNADRTVTFRKFFTIVAVDHRHVCINRYRRIQRFQDVYLTRSVVDMVFTTNNVSDFHIPVVDHHTEVVGRGTVGTADDQIVQLLVAEFDRPTDLVIKNNGSILRVGKTHHTWFISSMMFMTVAAATVVTRLLTVCHLLFTQRVQTFFGAVTFIRGTGFQHLINHGVVGI